MFNYTVSSLLPLWAYLYLSIYFCWKIISPLFSLRSCSFASPSFSSSSPTYSVDYSFLSYSKGKSSRPGISGWEIKSWTVRYCSKWMTSYIFLAVLLRKGRLGAGNKCYTLNNPSISIINNRFIIPSLSYFSSLPSLDPSPQYSVPQTLTFLNSI